MNAPTLIGRRPLRQPHRTPRYILDRTRQMRYERSHPDAPWLTPSAIRLLSSLLRPTDRGAEFGSGRSTIWLASRVTALTSIEHDSTWHAIVTARLEDQGLDNVECLLTPEDQPMARGGDSAYARIALGFADDSLDFALIDGHYRDYSAHFIMPKLRPGGLLIIDNVNWYLPCESRAPNSRTVETGPATEIWTEVWRQLQTWPTIWTSSGVWDTAFFIKR